MDVARTRPSPLRRLSQRLKLWKVRHAAGEAWQQVAYRAGTLFWPRIAPLYRRMLRHTTFIAVTGSCGKSTTRLLIEGAVGVSRSSKVRRGANLPVDNAHAIWTTRMRERYAVFEVSVGKYAEKDMVKGSAELIRPHVAVVLNIRDDHLSSFGSRDAIAREKSELVAVLDENGVAVLNADDPLVMGMQSRCRGRVMTFGFSDGADVRAENVQSHWPARLSFRVVHKGESAEVETQLCGAHWVVAALAAITAAVAAGVPLAQAARGLRSIAPFFARMNPQTRADGVTFVRDDVKAPLWTVPASLAFLADADVRRKIAVIGTISDYARKSRRVYADVARQALAVADHVIFVGAHASQGLRARRHPNDEALQAFCTLDAAHAYLAALVAPGDLVLLKGSNEDRLDLLAFERLPREAARTAPAPRAPRSRPEPNGVPAFAIIGLGNAGARYAGTRHNVGFACVDRLASRFGATFTAGEHAYVAQVEHRGACVHLVKPRSAMNATGSALVHVLDDLAIEPDRCILVHDEVALEVGRVRGRLEGGAGAHRGVQSVLEAFEDYRFARVKIGIGKPRDGATLEQHVLQCFAPGELDAIERALDAGAEQALLVLRNVEHRAPEGAQAGGTSQEPPAIAA